VIAPITVDIYIQMKFSEMSFTLACTTVSNIAMSLSPPLLPTVDRGGHCFPGN